MGWGEKEGFGEMQVSQMPSPCPASRPRTSGKGKKARRGRAGPEFSGWWCPWASPPPRKAPPAGTQHPQHPFPVLRRWVRLPLPLTARSRAEAGAPRDVTRGAAKGRGPCPPNPFPTHAVGIRMRSVYAGSRPALPRLGGDVPRRKPRKGQRRRNYSAIGEPKAERQRS